MLLYFSAFSRVFFIIVSQDSGEERPGSSGKIGSTRQRFSPLKNDKVRILFIKLNISSIRFKDHFYVT